MARALSRGSIIANGVPRALRSRAGMRIAFVAPLVAPLCDATSRGPHVVVSDLARALLARGHDVMVFCAQGSFLSGVPTAPIVIDASVTSAFQELYWHLGQWDPDVIAQHAFEIDAIS